MKRRKRMAVFSRMFCVALCLSVCGSTSVAVEAASEGELSERQKQWNGTWYGTMNVVSATGTYEEVWSGNYDTYMNAMAASSGYGENLLEYTIQLKPWGASWEKEISDEFGLVPAEIDAYNQAVAVDERPPYGSTPYNYEELSAEIKSLYAPETEAEAEYFVKKRGREDG